MSRKLRHNLKEVTAFFPSSCFLTSPSSTRRYMQRTDTDSAVKADHKWRSVILADCCVRIVTYVETSDCLCTKLKCSVMRCYISSVVRTVCSETSAVQYICSRTRYTKFFNLLNPTGQVMHQQFNIQQLYVLSTLYLCVLYLSENKQRLVPLTA